MNEKYLASKLLEKGQHGDMNALLDCFEVIRNIERNDVTIVENIKGENPIIIFNKENFNFAHNYAKTLRRLSAKAVLSGGGAKMLNLNKRCLLFDAPYDLDAAIRYAEYDREPRKRFYEPRRKQLLPIVKDLQRLEDGELEILAISMPPGVGKTTLAEMFIDWEALKHPELSILGGSHSNSILSGIYNEISRMTEPNGEYHWREIFPEINWRNTNAKEMRLDFGSAKRFETIQFSSIGSGNAGKVRASNILYCDDLIPDIETAMNRDRLEKIFQQYTTDLRQRKIGNCKELHIATRWSVHDVIGKLKAQYEGNPKAKFITFPALDENEESNFDYPYSLGFTTKVYHEQRDIMDDVSWKALYMNEPIEREGLLYHKDELRRYFELPNGEPDAILCVCDTKTTGSDYCVMPVAYKFGEDYYIEDVVCENFAPDVVENSLVNCLVKHNPHLSQFESNVAGGKLAEVVQSRIKEKGCRTKITTKWTQANKETKIQVNSPWVKEHCLFKDDSVIKGNANKEYRTMLEQLTTYTLAGKNKHDDTPDAFAQLAIFAQGAIGNKVIIRDRFF